ncbi:MAG TPA: DUF2784 domain-containing protein [Mycobacterium sp.]|jgi:Protein of Unknown function (DUF2784)|nr:DUF2784 domain-containing protein [Mycobacterium sp.]
MYEIVVALTVAMHFAFLGYLVVGGFLALRWRRTIWLHVPVVIWGIVTVVEHLDCPLTWLERWARAKAGMPPLPQGFIAHYITGVIYPASWAGAVQVVTFAMVALAWTLYLWRGRRRDAAVHQADRGAPDGALR